MAENFTTANYRIAVRGGHPLIKDRDGKYLNAEQLELLIRDLQCTHDYMAGYNMTQAEIEIMAYEEAVEEITETAKWSFNADAQLYATIAVDRRGKNTYSGESVYFILSPARPEQIKIGFSEDVYTRVKTFNREHKARCHCLAIAHTPDYKKFEYALHRKFKDHNVAGEWFQQQPVYEWLCDVFGAKQS